MYLEFDIAKCTEKFFENEENKEIKMLYSDVYCICIPHIDQVIPHCNSNIHVGEGKESEMSRKANTND
jgi:hypothetical protein